MRLLVHWRDEDGMRLPVTCWHPGPGYRMISSGVLGGGIGPRRWVLNAQVSGQYARTDPARHLTELARRLGLTGPGTGMLTAAQVADLVTRTDEGAEAAVTAGLRVPTWAAAPAGATDPELAPGTINIIVSVPVPLTDAALVNAVITATEAKTQAVLDAGFAGTGTATDAVCVAAPALPGTAAEDFAGPRSAWGARIARAVHAAVLAAATTYRTGLLAAIWRKDHAVTQAQFPLAEFARLGPYFALRDSSCAGDDAGFEPVTGLIADTPQAAARLGQRINDVSARVGTAQPWIGASIMFLGWAARLTSIYAGSAVLVGLVPDLAAARLYYQAPPAGPVDLLAAPLVAADPGTGWQLLAGHLDSLAAAIRRQVRIGQHLLRGNLASALAGSLMVLGRAGHGPLDELIGRPWAQPAELRRYGQWRVTSEGPRYVRTTCCGYTRLAGAGRCGDCSLSWRRPVAPR